MPQILLIDDDEALADLLIEYGERFSMVITACQHPDKGIETLRAKNFDAIILDVMLPDMDGFEACRQIRQFSDIPIIMLTARGDVTDRIVGLELGADDYLPKPFDPRELMARLQANIKRQRRSSADSLMIFDDLSIDPDTQEVKVADHAVSLTTKEYELLTLLANAPGKTFSRDDLLAALKGSELEMFSRSIDILVSRLRQKIKPATPIKTVHGKGYAFVARRRS
ncbi:MAG: response regulator transcription factor [Granulosicoccus sp.]|nr:response regulator transcription factor [Granulosicoccus sp.]